MKSSPIDSTIQRLYSVTKTPLTPFYPDNIIEDIFSQSNCKIDLETQKKTICFLLRLFDTPVDLKGAGLVEHFAIPFLQAVVSRAPFRKNEILLIMNTIQNWLMALQSFPDKSLFFSDVTILDSKLFRFHLEASDLKKPRRYADRIQREKFDGPSPLYRQYAPIVHLRIREFITRASLMEDSEERKDEHVRAARMFFNFMQSSIKYRKDHPAKIPEYYINNFVEEYDRLINVRISKFEYTEKRNYFTLGPRASTYRRNFINLVKNDYTPESYDERHLMPLRFENETSDYDFTQTPEGNIDCYQNSPDDIPDHLRILTHSYIYNIDNEDSMLHGIEAPLQEEYIYTDDYREDLLPRKPTLRNSWSEFINLKKFFFYWDSSFLNLHTYSVLYKCIYSIYRAEIQNAENAICAFLMVLIHTGIRPHYLLQTQINSSKSVDSRILPVMEAEEEYFKLIIELPIPPRRNSDYGDSLRTYKSLSIPVLYFIKPYIQNLFQSGKKFLFSFVDEKGQECRIDLTMIRAFLNQRLNKPHNLKISPEGIANSFFPLYSGRYGLDPIVACYISKNHYGIFNAPLHYIFIPKKQLRTAYTETALTVHKAIEENIKIMSEGKSLRTPVNYSQNPVSKRKLDESGYGSPQIPKASTWAAFIDNLKAKIKTYGLRELYRRHNLYSIYLYFAVMLSTGLRPRNNPDIEWDFYSNKLGKVILSEKLSPLFYEERIVPVASKTGKLIHTFRSNFPKFKTLVENYLSPGFSKFQPALLFFFLDRNYEQVPFELKEIKRILAEEYISFPMPLNTPRHYIRTLFYWEDFFHELASLFMGHQTSGKEWLNDFSSVDYSEAEAIFKEKVDRVMDELKFEVIPYLPKMS